jgi:hypothetical protein
LEREDVNEQDEFFRKFFVERARRDEIKGITRGNKPMDEEEKNAAEEGALDAAEEAGGYDDGKSVSDFYQNVFEMCHETFVANFILFRCHQFEDCERGWETDSEEEAFVGSLAESLMEDAADGAIDPDDEEPDMDDWGDLDSEKDKEEAGSKKSQDEDDEHLEMADLEDDEIDDNGNDDEMPDLEESDDDSDEGPAMDDQDAFMDAEDSDEGDNDGDDDDDDDLAFVGDSEGEEEEDEEDTPTKSRKKAKTMLPTFADAGEYEEVVNKSWNELKHSVPIEEETTPGKKEKKSKK